MSWTIILYEEGDLALVLYTPRAEDRSVTGPNVEEVEILQCVIDFCCGVQFVTRGKNL